jgi:hypothetical protein
MSRRQLSAAYRFLSPHQAAVLEAAIHQLMPAADEASAVSHLDRLLARFDARAVARHVRVADLRDHCNNGIALLDQLAGSDFAAVPPLQQGLLISHAQAAPFAALLLDHIVAAMYAPTG